MRQASGVDHRVAAGRRPRRRWPPCSSSAARCTSATPSSPATPGARCKALNDYNGKRVERGRPGACRSRSSASTSRRPPASCCRVVENERVARQIAQKRAQRLRAEMLARRNKAVSLEDLFAAMQEGAVQELDLIIKADVQGSVEAAEGELEKIQHPEVAVSVIHSGVGGITASDVNLAAASNAIVVGFNVRPNAEAQAAGRARGRRHPHVPRDLPADRGHPAGAGRHARARAGRGGRSARPRCARSSRSSRLGTIAGCMVTSGVIQRGAQVRVVRDGTIVHDGGIDSLQALPGRRPRGARRASSAASRSRATTTSRKATCSRCTRSRKSPAPASRRRGGSAFQADAAGEQALGPVGQQPLRPVGAAAVGHRQPAAVSLDVDVQQQAVVVPDPRQPADAEAELGFRELRLSGRNPLPHQFQRRPPSTRLGEPLNVSRTRPVAAPDRVSSSRAWSARSSRSAPAARQSARSCAVSLTSTRGRPASCPASASARITRRWAAMCSCRATSPKP